VASTEHALPRKASARNRGRPAGSLNQQTRQHLDHTVQFYEDDALISAGAAEFLMHGIADGQLGVVIATPDHSRAIATTLAASGLDVDAALADRRLILLDARTMLDAFMRDGMPDVELLHAAIDRMIGERGSPTGQRPVSAYGEMVDLLWREGNSSAAMRLEDLWNDFLAREDVSLFCAYSMASFFRESDADRVRDICARHTRIVPVGAHAYIDPQAPAGELAALRERTRAYEAEVRQRDQLEQRLREMVIRLQEREEDLSDVLENAAEGIHLVGPDGIIQWANRAELEILGYEAHEYVGHNIAEFHVDQVACRDILERLSRGETLQRYEACLRRKDGSVRHVMINSNVRWRNGKFLHTRCFITDVTEAREAAAERERALERERSARREAERASADAVHALAVAEQANRAKSEFLAVMSHELRTPLNAIGGYAELMELGIHGAVSPQQRDSLERIQRAQRMLLGLINEVLNYTRLETGNMQYHIADVAIEDMLRVIEALAVPQLRAKGLRYECDESAPGLSCRADRDKLQQIMLNLLSNAAKFTDPGGVIRVESEADGPNVVLRVRDTGIGITADKLEQIFEPFVQVDAHYTRTRDGVGLGLAISRDLARGMGGDLMAESTIGAGSTFTLRLLRGLG